MLMIVSGVGFINFKIFETKPDGNDNPFQFFERISDLQMVVEATFAGVAHTPEGLLYFTYDRSANLGGHKPCPT